MWIGHLGNGHRIIWSMGLGVVLLGLLALAACGPGEAPKPTPTATSVAKVATPSPTATAVPTPTPGPKKGGILNKFNYRDTMSGTLDPNLDASAYSVEIVGSMYNQLLRYDPLDSSELVPDLAKSWKISADGKSYVFTLRDDVKFSDGTPVTPEDVVYSLRRIVGELGAPVMSKRIGPNLKAVWGGAEVTGPNEVTVRIKVASAMFLGRLGSAYVKIVPKHVLDATEKKQFDGNPVGAGPFKLTKYQKGVVVEQERNPGYATSYKEGLPYLDGLRTYIIKDVNAQIAAMNAGQVDLWVQYPALDVTQGQSIKNFLGDKVVVDKFPAAAIVVQPINVTRNPVFKDPRVVKAFWIAMDRKTLNERVFEGGLVVGAILDPEVYPEAALPLTELYAYPGIKEPDYALAKKLLADAGYPNGIDVGEIVSAGSWLEDAATILNAGLAKAGIRMKEEVLDSVTAGSRTDAGLFDLAYVFSGGMDTPQVLESFMAVYITGGTRNKTYSGDPEIDRMISEAEQTLDPQKRNEKIREIQRYIYSNMSHGEVAIGVPKNTLAYRTYVKGYRPSLTYTDAYSFDTVWLQK